MPFHPGAKRPVVGAALASAKRAAAAHSSMMGAALRISSQQGVHLLVTHLSPRSRVDCTKVPDLVETATKRLLLPVHATEVCLH